MGVFASNLKKLNQKHAPQRRSVFLKQLYCGSSMESDHDRKHALVNSHKMTKSEEELLTFHYHYIIRHSAFDGAGN